MSVRRISFCICTAVNIVMLINEIVVVGNLSIICGYNLEKIMEYHFGENFMGTAPMWVMLVLLFLAYLLLIIDYCIEESVLLKILMIFCSLVPCAFFVAYIVYANQPYGVNMPKIWWSIAGVAVLIQTILILLSEDHNNKLIYLWISMAWMLLGVTAIVILVAIIIFLLLLPLLYLLFDAGGNGRLVDAYTAYGEYLGKIFIED